MKTYRVIAAILLSVFALFMTCPQTEASSPIRIAVINTTKNSELRAQSEVAVQNFTGTLAKSEAVAVAEREELELVIREQRISASELEDSAAKIGGIMGCEYMLLVSMTYEGSPVLSVRLVDVETSKIVYSDTEIPDSADESAMTAASSRMADKVLEVLAGEQAVITEINRKEITINRGSSAGVRKGDFYRVYTGTKRNMVSLAVIRVKDVHASFSYAEVVKNGGSLSLLHRSDNVEAVSKKEADSLIKGKKLAKKRPEEKRPEEKIAPKAKGDFLLTARKRYETLAKQEAAISKNNNLNVHNKMGDAWRNFGDEVMRQGQEDMRDMEEQASRLETLNAGSSSKEQREFQKTMQERSREADKLVRDSYASAIRCFEWSAQRGDAYAQNKLGVIYIQGVGVEKDYSKALEMLSKAAEQGNNNAEHNLANMYFKGLGVRQDNTKALEFLHRAADHGNDMSQANLGHAYLNGIMVKQDYTKAEEYLRKAVEQGSSEAQNDLGFMYFKGLVVKQNYLMAAELFRQSAGQGNSVGQFNLGYMYAQGYGMPQDIRQAIDLFRKAAAQGHEEAIDYLKKIGAGR